jgi:DNA recombination protein RmuC
VLGLRGLKVQEHAQEMMVDLQRIEGDLGKFREDYSVLGKHLKNAGGSYEEGAKRLDKFHTRLGMLTEVKASIEKKEIHESL